MSTTMAYLIAFERDALASQETLKAKVRHYRRYQPTATQRSRPRPVRRDQCHDLIAVDDLSFFIHNNQPVGVPIECDANVRSEEHTSELQSLMRISYAVFCLKKKK